MKVVKRIFLKSLLISFLYVGLGTVSVLGMFPASPIYWDLSYLGFLITLPVSVLSFGVVYTEGDNYTLVFIIQIIMFLLFWLIVYRMMLKRQKRKEKRMKK